VTDRPASVCHFQSFRCDKVNSFSCDSAAYTSLTRGQKRFTVLKVAADWHELMIPAAHYAAIHCPRQQTTASPVQPTGIPPPQSATLGLHPVVRELLLISAEGRRLS